MASTDQLPLPASFNSSLADFQKRLTAAQIEEFKFATFQSLQEAINQIQKEQAQRNSIRNLNKIRPFLNGLSQYSKIIELFINMEPLLAAIWGPIKFCLQVASNLNEAFDTLLDAYEKIGSALPMIQAVDKLFYSQPPIQQVLVNVFEDILTFHKRAIVFFGNKTWKLTFRMTFHTFSDLFGDVLKNLERSRNLLMQSASIAHFQEAQEARIHFTRQFETQTKRDKQEQRLAVIEWLSADRAKRANFDEHIKSQQVRAANPLTTQWLFNISAMRSWLRKSDTTSPIFWLSGILGAGKTVLFSSVVDKIVVMFPQAQMVYFYCKYSDHWRRTFDAVIRTLIVQILDLSPPCLDYLYEKMIKSSERHVHSQSLLQDLLEELCINHDLLFICIDGLDECDLSERTSLLSLIGRITKASRIDQSVRFFVTSRKETDIERSLNSVTRLNIRPQHVENDILLYIKAQTTRLRDRFNFGFGEEHDVREKLSSRPQGMFLLARLITDNLIAQRTRQDFEEEMDSDILPNGIEQAYDRIMVRLSKNRSEKTQQRAKLILEIITSATRALQSHEIQGALSIRLEDQTIDFNRRRLIDPLGDICGPIIEVHANGVVEMIHSTAKSYLLQCHSNYFIDLRRANLIMAKLCVAYLTFPSFNPNLSDLKIEEYTKAGDYSFQDYATCNWIYHMESSVDFLTEIAEAEREAFENCYNLLRNQHLQHSHLELDISKPVHFLEHKIHIKIELAELRKLYSVESIFDEALDNGHIPHLLFQIGRARAAIEKISIVPFSTNEELFVSAYGTAVYKCPNLRCPHFQNGFTTKSLRDAHYRRHERPFKCELEECEYPIKAFITKAALDRHVRLCHEALPDQPLFPKISRAPIDKALKEAIDKEDTLAVRTLAMELLDLQDAPTGFLLKAVEAGKRESASILIEILGETKEMDHRDSSGNTALHMLAENGDVTLISSMLATSVTVNTERKCPKGVPSTALQIAVFRCSVPTVRLLLQHKHAKRILIANKASATRDSILSWAVMALNCEILELLLKTGWEVFKNGTDIIDALAIFATKNIGKVGSDDDIKRKLLGILLVWARVLGVEERYPIPYIEWILPHVDDMVPVFMGETSIDDAWEASKNKCVERIQNATLEGDISKISLLLSATGLHYISNKHGTVLTIAALYGKIDIVQMLIGNGEDIRQTVNEGNSALENAATGGFLPIVHLLLEYGANLNEETRERSDGTALQCAAANGHETVVRFLLGNKAEVDMHGNGKCNKESALVKAASSPFESVALLLLEHGADISAKSARGESVLHLAVRKKHRKLAIQLITSGAAVDELTAAGDTVLMIAAENGMEEVTAMLLEYEIVKDQIDFHGGDWTDTDGYRNFGSALLRAASNGHFKVVELLLKAHATPNAPNYSSQMPIQVADQNGYSRIVDLLRSYGAS